MCVAACSGEVLSGMGKLAAVEGVLLFLDGEELPHRGHVVVLEDTHPAYTTPYVLVTPSTFTFVFTVGRHLHNREGTSRRWLAPRVDIPQCQSRVLYDRMGTFFKGVE